MPASEDAPGILVISTEGEAYARLLHDLPVTTCTEARAAGQSWSGQPVVLGEPHRVAPALAAMPGVTWVQSTWAGVSPLLEAARRGVAVTGVKGVFGPQMAEYALAYMLARELDVFGRFVQQHAGAWDSRPSGRLAGRRLGVMGTGSIGAHVAGSAVALGMRVRGYSRAGTLAAPFEAVFAADRLPDFLDGLDYLFAALPDTPETDGLLDARAFDALPPHACLINVGRGNLVVEQDLVDALEAGRLGGAVLDVFREEPLPRAHPFWSTPNLLVTGHVAARSEPEDIAAVFRANYARFRSGSDLAYRLDPERGY